ncbi:hypothetical protein N657DRAFT_580714 [Parathielavia appendiculata]|uniref:Uncharacterized protein n=1 Tax=Parathielavia appendiculata TaxID=2587402 RepID=A0AAN6TSP6_9PEZI|nr:hypothetical protein N657DRAFT_580714 [Parathielavia appendiculata]
MRSIWQCSSCTTLFVFAVLGREASGSHAARQWKDVHRIPKAQVTAHPARRQEGTCPTEHTLCAASFSGGCCPSRYACAVDSCYATTAGPATACGLAGYFACAPVNGEAGCCPVGYVCGSQNCLPPAGISYPNTQCPTDYYLCPSSANYGCCMSGMGCAPNACYSTEPVTTTILQAITTISGSETITSTRSAVTVSTPTPPPGPTDSPGVAAKFIPTSVPKVPASTPTSEASGGLSAGAIGGIIAGVVILLVAVIVAAFLIIQRLKRVEDVMESKRGSSSGKKTRSQSHAQMEHYGRQLHSDVDDMSVDPLIHINNNNNNNSSSAATPKLGPNSHRGRSDSTGFTPSPNMFEDCARHASPDANAGGYFDDPAAAAAARVHNIPGAAAAWQTQQQQQQQNMLLMQPATIHESADSTNTAPHHRPYAYTHWRQMSNASELSADGSENGAGVTSPLVGGGRLSELDGSGVVELPSGDGGGLDLGPGVGYAAGAGSGAGAGVRSRSGSAASARGMGHARRRSDGVQGQGVGQGQAGGAGLGLTPLDEAAEMHGYYGRPGQQAGQTAAGLDGQWDGNGAGENRTQGTQEGRGVRGS